MSQIDLIRGKPFPSVAARDLQGRDVKVEDFNQKSHVILIAQPGMAADAFNRILDEARARQKTWDWLYARVLGTNADTLPVGAGVYAIDRYGQFIASFPMNADVWDLLEKEFIYFEAKHC